jgi:large subunit ribosomal protein L31
MAKSNTKLPFYPNATAKCTNCGSIYNYGSSIENLSIEICGNCHPFYTGKAVLVDTAGRIDKFQNRMTKIVTDTKAAKTKVRKSVQSLSDLIKEDDKPEIVKPAKVKAPKAEIKETVTPVAQEQIVDNEAIVSEAQ